MRKVQVVESPEYLDEEWDKIATCYFQKIEFLTLLHQYNPCNQRYYELYLKDELVSGAVVYTLKVNALTFTGYNSALKMHVIGLPVSVAASSVIGEQSEFNYFINEILKREKGIILGLNLPPDLVIEKGVNMMTLPTIVFYNRFSDFENYYQSLRHPYRRRVKLIQSKALNVENVVTGCKEFTEQHYRLYMEIMNRTSTKLEILSLDLFRNLPSNFVLTTLYHDKIMLAWHIICYEGDVVFFFFGGMDYGKRDLFQSYHNNLLGILKAGIENHCSMIDFGQTAETAKLRLGGELWGRGMFIYHKNPLVLFLFSILRRWLTYSKKQAGANVFKD